MFRLIELLQTPHPLICIQTVEERRAQALVELAALQRPLKIVRVSWSTEHSSAAPSLAQVLAELRQCQPSSAYIVLDLDAAFTDPGLVRMLRDLWAPLVESGSCLVGVQSSALIPAALARDLRSVVLPPPAPAEISSLFRAVVPVGLAPEVLASAEAAWIRESRGLTGSEVEGLMRAALGADWLTGPAVAERLRQEKRQVALGADSLRWVEPDVTWTEVGGLGALRAWLERRRPALAPEARAFGLPYPKGVLLAGVQGCGKSLCAKALADLWGLPLARLDLGLLFRPGSSPELEMHRALAAVEGLAPAALWVDELDKVWSGAGAVASDSASRALGLLVTWLQERKSEVPLVATANNVDGLPPELVRKGRFDEIFFVDLPTEAERRQILSIHLRQRHREPQCYDVDAVAARTEHFSGAELERIIVEGLHEAFAEGRELTTGDLLLAAAETVPLAVTFEEPVRALREWARGRARSASGDSSILELFRN